MGIARLAMLAALLAHPLAARAQIAAGGAVSGYVTDQQGSALPSVRITVAQSLAPINRILTTDRVGAYRAANLDPGDYTITATMAGFARVVRPDVAVREGASLVVNLTLPVGSISDTVMVRADPPRIDARSPAHFADISGDLQASLPLSSLGNWADFLLLAPGVATTQARLQTYFLHGTSHGSGVYLVDGADATSALQGSTLYSQFATGTFNDIQVATGGVDASTPLGVGPVVNITSRSGTNQWHGTVGGELQPTRWNAGNTPDGQDATVTVRQGELALGGPVRRDRWWVFGSSRVARNATGNPQSAQQVGYLRRLEPSFEPFDNDWSGRFLFVKLTGQPSARHAVTASFSRDVVTLGGAQPNEAARFRDIRAGGPGWFGRLSSTWSPAWLTRVSVGYNGKKQENLNTQPDTAGLAIHQTTFASGGRLVGTGAIGVLNASPFSGTDFDVDMWTLTADATYTRSDRSGAHTIQGGVYVQPSRRNRWISRYNNGGFQLEEAALRVPGDFDSGLVPFHRQIFDVPTLVTRDVVSRDAAAYVQDAWNVGRRLTVKAGVRVDFITRADRIVDVTTQRTAAVGPRAGIAYTPDADFRSVLWASWGRVHDNLTGNDATAGSAVAGARDLYDTSGDGTFSTVIVSPPRTARSSDLIVDLHGYRQPHADELIVGYRRQVPTLTTIDVSATRRAYRDRPALVETNAIYDGSTFVGYRDPNQNGIYQLTSNVWNWPVLTALQISATRQAASLTAVAGYTRSWNHLEGTWVPRDPASFIQPDAFPNHHGIGFVSGCTSGGAFCPDSDSLSQGFGGGNWRDHLAHAAVVYRAPWSLELAGAYTFQSGPWSGPIQTRLVAPDPRFGPPTVTLPTGRLVSNPLATPVRFAFATRGDNQLRLPALQVLSARVGRSFRVGTRRLDVAGEVLNVTNAGADQTFQPGAQQQFSPFYGRGALRQFPRTAALSARFAF
jgi:hypothetical protein